MVKHKDLEPVSDYVIAFRHIYDELPDSAKHLITVLGLEDAAFVVEKMGGVQWPVSKAITRQGDIRYQLLAERVGVSIANKITKHFSGKDLYIPACTGAMIKLRELRIKQEFDRLTAYGDAQHSAREAVHVLALQFKMCDRTVWRILKRPDTVTVPSVYRNGELF